MSFFEYIQYPMTTLRLKLQMNIQTFDSRFAFLDNSLLKELSNDNFMNIPPNIEKITVTIIISEKNIFQKSFI